MIINLEHGLCCGATRCVAMEVELTAGTIHGMLKKPVGNRNESVQLKGIRACEENGSEKNNKTDQIKRSHTDVLFTSFQFSDISTTSLRKLSC